jgi:hypothetical protein
VVVFRKSPREERFNPRILESFDPVTRELYRYVPATIHTEIHAKVKAFEERLGSTTNNWKQQVACLFSEHRRTNEPEHPHRDLTQEFQRQDQEELNSEQWPDRRSWRIKDCSAAAPTPGGEKLGQPTVQQELKSTNEASVRRQHRNQHRTKTT